MMPDAAGKTEELSETEQQVDDLSYSKTENYSKSFLKPEYTFERGIEETIQWYLDNTDWTNQVKSGQYQEYYEKMYADR